MRRLIAVLVLLGGGGSQFAALGCPMGAPITHEATAVGAHPEGHGAGGHHAAAPTQDGHDGQAAQPEQTPSHRDASRCSMAMGCGTALVLPTAAAVDATPDTTVPRLAIVCSPCSATFPNDEPPPPRLLV